MIAIIRDVNTLIDEFEDELSTDVC